MTLQRLLCLCPQVLILRGRASLQLKALLTRAVAMAVKPAKRGCVVLLMGKSQNLLLQQSALMAFSVTVARLRTIVAQGANPTLASALDPPSPSAGTWDGTDTYFVAVDFTSEV